MSRPVFGCKGLKIDLEHLNYINDGSHESFRQYTASYSIYDPIIMSTFKITDNDIPRLDGKVALVTGNVTICP